MQCYKCGLVQLVDFPVCLRCEELHEQLIERLLDGDDHALSLAVLTARIVFGPPHENIGRNGLVRYRG
jgi:hypothetical protein